MIVTLSAFAHQATLNICTVDEAIHAELKVDVTKKDSRQYIIDASYAAWKFAYLQLYALNYGTRGVKRPFGKQSNFTALRKITQELNYTDTHPALQGVAMFGIHHDIFPVWEIEPSERHPAKYSSYPRPGHRFVVLEPTWYLSPQYPKMTWWVPHETGVGRLCIEETHLPLWRLEAS